MTWIPDLPPEPGVPRAELVEWLVRQFRQLSTWSEGTDGETDVASKGGICSISGNPRALSGSNGGAPIPLDDASVPGKVIHANGASSGVNAVPICLHIYNPDAEERPIWYTLQGPSVPVPTSRSQMQSQIIPPSLRGPEPVAVPCVIEPGYTLHVSADAGNAPMQLFGMVDEIVSAGVLGYGGLAQQAGAAMGTITTPAWVTVPMDAVQVTNPINIVHDVANNRFQVNAEGIWYAATYGVFTCDKLNADRVLLLRIWDETAGASLTAVPFSLNVEDGTNNGQWSVPVLYEVPAALVGHWFRIEIGGSTTTFTTVQMQKAGISFVRISPTI